MSVLTSEILYKILDRDGSCFHGGVGKWSLPHDGEPGDWLPAVEGPLVACENGYHLCREQDLLGWLGPLIGIAEWQGERLDTDNKVVVRGPVRLVEVLDTWNERTQRLFTCDCAEHVLPLYEKEFGEDEQIRNCIETTRRHANGQANNKELAAASAAIWGTTRAAASAAANAATIWAAAASAATRGTIWDAARDAERKWQTKRLMQYLLGQVA